MFKLLALTTLSIVTVAEARRWDLKENDPNHLRKVLKTSVVFHMSDIPLSGKLEDERLGWSESYWPAHKGGIAYRWNHPYPNPFNYALHTKEEVMRMSREELEELSPAELYDISQGDYSYSLTKKVLSHSSKDDLWWEGICDGWALAASMYPEPSPVIVKNPHGLKVPFGSSDVKALLALHGARNASGTYARVGDRCAVRGKVPGEASTRDGEVPMPSDADANSPACGDVNAGAFHVSIGNLIGIHSQGMVADVDRFNDVWNQPVTSYKSEIKEVLFPTPEELLMGVEKKYHISMVMTYGEELQFYSPEAEAKGEINFVSKKPVTRTLHQAFRSKNYEYILEVDKYGKITGGEWISITRPDFLWLKARDKSFLNGQMPLAGLKYIYKPVKY